MKLRIAVIFETELWPNIYHEGGRCRIPARPRERTPVAARRRRYQLIHRPVPARRCSNWVVIVVRRARVMPSDLARSARILTRTHVTGNLRFDFAAPGECGEDEGRGLRAQYAQYRRAGPVWVAGSTHEGEEALLLEAHR